RHEKADQVSTIFFVPESHPTTALTGGAELTWRRALVSGGRGWTLNAGTQLERSRLSSSYRSTADGSLETRTQGDRTSGSGFASANLSLGRVTSLKFGVRGDAI